MYLFILVMFVCFSYFLSDYHLSNVYYSQYVIAFPRPGSVKSAAEHSLKHIFIQFDAFLFEQFSTTLI